MITLKCRKDENLIRYLTQTEGLSFSIVNKLLRNKDIKVNGIRIKNDIKLDVGDEIIIYIKPLELFKIDVVFEDDNIIVVNKPKKLEVISETKDISLLNLINNQYFAVHRLDYNTQGLVVLAKTEKAKNELDKVFKDGFVEKKYVTVCINGIEKETTFVDYLVKFDKIVKIFSNQVQNSKVCKLKITPIKRHKQFSLNEIELFTGRTHQIRAQLAFHKLYVLGDEKYGDFKTNKEKGFKNQILKCYSLKFKFPNDSSLAYLNEKQFKISYDDIEALYNSL